MYSRFDIAGGSIQGYTHTRQGQNNQDALTWVILGHSPDSDSDDATSAENINQTAIAIVCDGCGSSTFSEVGSQVGTRFLVNAIAKRLQRHLPQYPQKRLSSHPSSDLSNCPSNCPSNRGNITDNSFWHEVQIDVLQRLRSLSTSLTGNESEAIYTYLLFTIMGAVITAETTVVFGLGDGVFAINGDIQSMGPFDNNAPPYLAYGLLPDDQAPFTSKELKFIIHRQVPTSEVRSLLIGSDGVNDLRAIASHPLPGKNERVGELSQFWQSDRYFKNPDMVRRRLALINRESVKPDWQRQQLTKQGGLLPDDTTLVVMRRAEF